MTIGYEILFLLLMLIFWTYRIASQLKSLEIEVSSKIKALDYAINNLYGKL